MIKMNSFSKSILFFATCFFSFGLFAQQNEKIQVLKNSKRQEVIITAGGKPFTTFIYPDSLEKPALYPIYAPDESIITRGFPINTRANDPQDHPHHIGLWLNYENVNGLDFWNNSYAIPQKDKSKYGWIKTDSILETKNGKEGILKYSASWKDTHENILLTEVTSFIFHADKNERIIDRITTLTAMQDVSMPDAKDGLMGLRVTHELQLPSNETKKFTDNKGNITVVKTDSVSTGNYLTSKGKEGDSAWGTRAVWCMLYGKMNNDTVSIAVIDHPGNIGYPTYWHARGYGLFAANPLGQKIFSNGKEELNFGLKKGESVTFRYRIVISSSNKRLATEEINKLSDEFAKTRP